MSTEPTRISLINAAMELFAEKGFDGVSTRMIAEKAGVNLGGIHYHFKSKENLFVEAFKAATEKDQRLILPRMLDIYPEKTNTPEGRAWLIAETLKLQFEDLAEKRKEPVMRKMVLQAIVQSASVQALLVEEIFRPELDQTAALFRQFCPKLKPRESQALAEMMVAPLVFYITAETPLLLLRGENSLNTAYFRIVARQVALSILHLLNLPLPEHPLLKGATS